MKPKKIEQHFVALFEKNSSENNITDGVLTCCNDHSFEVFVFGETKRSFLSSTCLSPKNDTIILEARCKNCGNRISVFDSRYDGYDHCGETPKKSIDTSAFGCKKCQDGDFSVSIKYEYPSIQELKDLGIEDFDNAFTWIWISLECNKCGTRYRNIVSCETA